MPEIEKTPFGLLDILSFVVLLLAAGLLFYTGFYRTAEQNKSHFLMLTQRAEDDLKILSDAQSKKKRQLDDGEAEDQNQPDSISLGGSISDVSMFLQKINTETRNSDVELSNIEKLDKTTYKMTAFAPFYRLVHFLFKIEQSNLAIQEMEILPFTTQKNLIHMTLRVIGNEMSKTNLRTLNDFESQYSTTFRDTSGNTDPFKSFIAVMEDAEKKRRKPRTYLETFDLSQLTLIAIVVGPNENWAMVREPMGKGHVIKKGTAIGKNGGIVYKITDKEVIIREKHMDFSGRTKNKDIAKKVP